MEEDTNFEDRVHEWESGLPTATDLTPLSHILISPQLASAFSITAEPFQTMLDVNRASHTTLSTLRRQSSGFSSNNFKVLSSFMDNHCSDPDLNPDPIVVNDEELDLDLVQKRKHQTVDFVEEIDLNDECSARTLKRARLVWTPHLHKRFVDVVTHLGIDNVVPKTIMQLMNVEGLTRENVASHLQKYRLYLKRKDDGGSSNDHLFAAFNPIVSRGERELNESRALPMVNSASGSYNRFQMHQPQRH